MREISFSHLTALEIGPPELIDFVADAGFHSAGIRIQPAVKGGNFYPIEAGSLKLDKTLERMKARDVKVLDIEVMRIDGDTNIIEFLPAIEVGAQLGATRICVNGEDENLSRFTHSFAELCRIAGNYGMEVDLEFMLWRPIKNLEIAEQIVRDTGCANGKVLIDALHLTRSGGTVAKVQAMNPEYIGALQICDVPLLGPDITDIPAILGEARAGRLPPLEGELPLVELIRAVPASTPISVEVPMQLTNRFESLLDQVSHIKRAADICLSKV
jgi:sugar phosphate isomerase/epimerase